MAAKTRDLPKNIEGFLDLVEAVDKEEPNKSDVRKLQKLLKEKPALWVYMGDIVHISATHLIDSVLAPKSMKLSLERGWVKLQHQLGLEEATQLEQLIIQQVVLSWIRLGIVDYKYTSVTEEGSPSYRQADYWERRLNAAQRRFLRACVTLARVRKMKLPAVQVNIAEKQVNQVNTN